MNKELDTAIARIEKLFGKGSITRLGGNTIVPVKVISTGSPKLNAALGVGGLPRGRVVEVYGPESGGKTTITLQVIAEAQKIAESFDNLLEEIETYCPEGRELAIVKTKLEEAAFFAKKSMANQQENQE